MTGSGDGSSDAIRAVISNHLVMVMVTLLVMLLLLLLLGDPWLGHDRPFQQEVGAQVPLRHDFVCSCVAMFSMFVC